MNKSTKNTLLIIFVGILFFVITKLFYLHIISLIIFLIVLDIILFFLVIYLRKSILTDHDEYSAVYKERYK